MRDTFVRTTTTLLLAATLAVVAVAPSYASEGVGLSFDGVHWSSQLSRPLFSGGLRWVPGDVATRSFWVRNQGPTGARMTIAVTTSDPDRLVAEDDVNLRARVAGGSWVELRNGAASRRLIRQALQRGQRGRVEVQAAFDAASTNGSQRSTLPLRFVVTLTQAVGTENTSNGGPGALPGDHGSGDGTRSHGGTSDGILPDTGSDVGPGLLWTAAVLIGSGAAILFGRRRKHEEDAQHVSA